MEGYDFLAQDGGIWGGLENLGEGLEYLGEEGWSTWERGVGVPGR